MEEGWSFPVFYSCTRIITLRNECLNCILAAVCLLSYMGSGPAKEPELFPIREEDVEVIARREHNDWMEMMEGRGFHPPSHCTWYGRGCAKCNPDVLPYDSLPEGVKKRQLRRFLNMGHILEEMGYRTATAPPLGNFIGKPLGMGREPALMEPEPLAVRARTSTYRHP